MTGMCLAGSGRQTTRTWMAAVVAVYSRCPSCAKLLPDGDGVVQRDARTNVNPKRSPLGWAPGSGREGSQGYVGWTGAKSGSRRGSLSARPAAGAAGEEARGTVGA